MGFWQSSCGGLAKLLWERGKVHMGNWQSYYGKQAKLVPAHYGLLITPREAVVIMVWICHIVGNLKSRIPIMPESGTKPDVMRAGIKQANDLTSAEYDLPLRAKRVISLLLLKLYREAEGKDFIDNKSTVSVADYQKYFKAGAANASDDMRRGVEDLLTSYVTFYPNDGVIAERKYNWLMGAGVRVGRGVWELELNTNMMPYLYNMKDRFTLYSLFDVQDLRSTRVIRFYENMMRFRSTGEWDTSYDWLAQRFSLPKSQRTNNAEMKRTFIEPTIKKINEHTPYIAKASYSKDNPGAIKITFVKKPSGTLPNPQE